MPVWMTVVDPSQICDRIRDSVSQQPRGVSYHGYWDMQIANKNKKNSISKLCRKSTKCCVTRCPYKNLASPPQRRKICGQILYCKSKELCYPQENLRPPSQTIFPQILRPATAISRFERANCLTVIHIPKHGAWQVDNSRKLEDVPWRLFERLKDENGFPANKHCKRDRASLNPKP